MFGAWVPTEAGCPTTAVKAEAWSLPGHGPPLRASRPRMTSRRCRSHPADARPEEQEFLGQIRRRIAGRIDAPCHRVPALRQLVENARLAEPVRLASPFACPPEEITASPEHACLPGAARRFSERAKMPRRLLAYAGFLNP